MRLRYTRLPLAAALSLLGILPGLASSPPKGIEFHHGDWTLACDNTRTCRAAGYQTDQNDPDVAVSILLTRKAGPNQPVRAQLMLGQLGTRPFPTQLALQINGNALGAPCYNADEGTAVFTPAQVAALLSSLARDSRIVLLGNDGTHWTVSDRGASAVLLKMDEFQGRLGTPGALIRKGRKAEATVLPPVAMPVIVLGKVVAARPADQALANASALRRALAAATPVHTCDVGYPDQSRIEDDGPQGITVQRLSEDKLLVSTVCWDGSVHLGMSYWVVNDRTPYKPRLVTASAVDDNLRTIEEIHRGRTIADCMRYTTWGWTGARFVTVAEADTGLCRRVAAGGAWHMPTLVSNLVEQRDVAEGIE